MTGTRRRGAPRRRSGHRASWRRALATVLVLAAAMAAPVGAVAATLELPSAPVTIHFRDHDRRVAREVYKICERSVPVVARQLGVDSIQPIDIRVEDDITPYRLRLGSHLPTWGVAFAILEDQMIVVDVPRATRAWNSLNDVIPHELSHLLIAQRAPGVRFPIWFLEGLAQWQAGEWSLVDSWQLMNAVWGGQSPPLWQIDTSYPVSEEKARTAYRLSYAAFTDLFASHPEELPRFLALVAKRGSFETAFEEFRGETVPAFTADFQQRLEARYHSRLLVFQDGPLFSIIAIVFLGIALRYWFRKRRKLRDMDRLDHGLWPDDAGDR